MQIIHTYNSNVIVPFFVFLLLFLCYNWDKLFYRRRQIYFILAELATSLKNKKYVSVSWEKYFFLNKK